jgi:RNA polymerase sigma-70 factor (ECF subfamily)
MADKPPAANAVREETEERRLVEAAQTDPAKFGELYEIHFEKVYAFIAKRVRDRDTAEDLTSDVFHKALANLRKFEWRGAPFAAWLIKIAANAIADQSKRAARETRHPEEPPESAVEPDMDAIEHQALVFRLVDRLPADQRRVIFERFAEQRSIREIAAQWGRSEGAVKQLQFRALQNLRNQMEGSHA